MRSSPLLDHIHTPADLKKLSATERVVLCDELRAFVRAKAQEKEGHIVSSLGVTELTVALHTVYHTPHDILIWDVGHQAYVHKVLTGRKAQFHTIRQQGGLSGFPVMRESVYDAFGVGHSATALSALGGMAVAAKKLGQDKKFVAVVGDGALTGGMAFEALNHLSTLDIDLVLVFNDNQQSIDSNTGALHLQKTYAAFFESLGWAYSGPVAGNQVNDLVTALSQIRQQPGRQVLHVQTIKPQPLTQAPKTTDSIALQEIFGATMIHLAQLDQRVTGITPAMLSGCSMDLFQTAFPDRTFDVGIAEQHAVTFAAGQAAAGLRPFVNLYSTFAQRAVDQIIHDVALQNLPVVFCIERAGLVGEDGPTHHGSFDISLLRSIPNLVVAAPKSAAELRDLMFTALHHSGPFAIRYPKAAVTKEPLPPFKKVAIGSAQCVQKGTSSWALLSTGFFSNTAKEVGQLLPDLGVYHFPFIKPLDHQLLAEIGGQHQKIITLEEGAIAGGFGSAIAQAPEMRGLKIWNLGIDDQFITHGSARDLYAQRGLSTTKIVAWLQDLMEKD